jgi:hypothetical protein
MISIQSTQAKYRKYGSKMKIVNNSFIHNDSVVLLFLMAMCLYVKERSVYGAAGQQPQHGRADLPAAGALACSQPSRHPRKSEEWEAQN